MTENVEDPTVPKNARLLGDQRKGFEGTAAKMYEEEHLTIRQISEVTGRSYGAVHRALTDAGVKMRPRGNRVHR